jgi:hypothetical protein
MSPPPLSNRALLFTPRVGGARRAHLNDIRPGAQAAGLPRRPRARPSAAAELEFREQVAAFCALIRQIQSNNGFQGRLRQALRQRMGR